MIQSFLEDYYQAMSDRDWEEYRQFFLPQARLTTVWQDDDDSEPMLFDSSIDEFIAQTPQGPDSQPIFEEKMTSSKITVKGGLAQAWVGYDAKFGSPDSLMEWSGYDLFSLLRYQDTWKITSLTYGSE